MTVIRVGIIGLGLIASRHLAALDAIEGVELIAACDQDHDRAQLVAGPRRATAYQRWEEMLDRERLDAVWVCTPPLAHRDPALAALGAGVHVYLEKPIARTLPDGQAIVDCALRGEAICAVGYQWHASELLDAAREATVGQTIGMLAGRNYGPVAARPWFIDRIQGGGQLLERASHHVDLQRALAGEVVAVEAAGGGVRLAQAGPSEGDIEDVVALTLHFESGAIGTVNTAWTRDDQPEVYGMDVIASDATLSLELGPQYFRLSGVACGREVRADSDDPFNRSVDRFIDAVRSGDRSRVFCTPEDALRTLVVVVSCERALVEGARVAVRP